MTRSSRRKHPPPVAIQLELPLFTRLVSTRPQRKDLDRQVARLLELYPTAEVVREIAVGLNLRRKGLLDLLGRVHVGDVKLIVVAHKDRLARFRFDIIEWFCQLHECRIMVLNQENLSPEQELVQDIVAILHSFSSRLYSRSKYQKQIKEELQVEAETRQVQNTTE